MRELPAHIHISWGHSPADLAARFAPLLPATRGPLPVVPAPLEWMNEPIANFRDGLRASGRPSTLLLPRGGVGSLLRRGRDRWPTVDVARTRYRLDRRLTAESWLAVLAITPELRRGPFMLDLPFQFLHPRDRLRFAGHPHWRAHRADLAAQALPALTILLHPAADGWLGIATGDPVAAELWSLALAERWLGDDVEMQGPWEDATVQRATELELGVRIPRDMVLTVAEGTALPTVARELLMEISSRLGLPHSGDCR